MRWENDEELIAQGAENKALETAQEMIINGEPNHKIIKYTKLPLEKIAQLRSELTPSGV